MDFEDMDLQNFVIWVVPVFLCPILVDLLIGWCRKASSYRMNDLMTNLSLSMMSVISGIVIMSFTITVYENLYTKYALLDLDSSRVLTWLGAFIGYDFLYYWAHRAHHASALLWGVHTVHHSGEDMNLGLALRQSVFSEATTWVFYLPMAFVGVDLKVYLTVTGIQLVYQYWIHNTYVSPLGWLEWILVTPSQHRVHHAMNQRYIDKNFGNVLVLWDRLFGTYQAEVSTELPLYGINNGIKTWDPIRINFQYLKELAYRAAFGRGLDKILVFIKNPSWSCFSLNSPERHVSPPFSIYNPSVPQKIFSYCVLQLSMAFFVFFNLLWSMDSLKPEEIAISVGCLFTTNVVIGGLLDGKEWIWRIEIFRSFLLAILVLGDILLGWRLTMSIISGSILLLLISVAGLFYFGCWHRTAHPYVFFHRGKLH